MTDYGRGESDDRMVDALEEESWLNTASGVEVAAFDNGVYAGLYPE